MSDGEALLRSILAAPADDAPRLVYADWLEDHGEGRRAADIRWGVRSRAALTCSAPSVETFWCDGSSYTVRRGFIESVRFSTADFLAHAADLFAAHPIMAVRLTDRRPSSGFAGDGQWGWWESDNWPNIDEDIPTEIAEAFADKAGHTGWFWYPTREAAHAALSSACVAYGRAEAGLSEANLTSAPSGRARPSAFAAVSRVIRHLGL